MAKNTIIMIGDGMGWEMARAAAIAQEVAEGKQGNALKDFYTQGKGQGLSFQELGGYNLATTYGTTIADQEGRFSTGNSALLNSDELGTGPAPSDPPTPPTGANPIRPDFEFDPAFNPGNETDGGAFIPGTAPSPGEGGGSAEDDTPTVEDAGNLVGYDPARGGPNPWTSGNDPEYIKHSYPDSANTATTLYTGVKSYNNATGVDIFEQDLETIFETARKEGQSTGLVSSVPVDHATPGAGYASVNRRSKYDEEFPALDNILQQGLRETQPTVLLGGGHPLSSVDEAPLPEGVEPDFTYITEDTYNELSNNPEANRYGYTFLERDLDADKTLRETAAETDPEAGERLLGLYGARGQNGNLPVSSANGDYSTTGLDMFSRFSSTSGDEEDQTPEPDTERPLLPGETDEAFIAREVNENPTLTQLTSAALDVLEDDQDGFTMMVEGGDIDWAAHDDNLDNLLGTMNDFDKAVQTTLEWIEQNGGFEENQLIVTADHDHYLTLNEDFPKLLREKGAEALTAESDPAKAGHYWGSDPNIKYGWGSHTNRPVPVYSQGNGTEKLNEFAGQGYDAYGEEVPGIEGLIDQTHIYQTLYASVTGDAAPLPVPPIPDPEAEAEAAPPFCLAKAGGDVANVDAGEVIFGGDGADLLDASTGGGDNRVFGRDGDDVLIAGLNDRLAGDRGNDALFAGNGGSTLTGGEGQDQFWVAYGGLPNSANTITDFQAGTDTIGIAGISGATGFEDLTLRQSGSDTRIGIASQPALDIAILTGTQVSTLDSNSFAFELA